MALTGANTGAHWSSFVLFVPVFLSIYSLTLVIEEQETNDQCARIHKLSIRSSYFLYKKIMLKL